MKKHSLKKGGDHPLAQNSDDEYDNAYPINAVDSTFNEEDDTPQADFKHKFNFKSSKKAYKEVS